MAQLIDEYLGAIKDRNIEMALREIIKIVLESSGGATDADIAAIAALPGTPGLLRKLGVNSWEIDTTDYSGGGALDADLVAIAALAGTSGFLTKTGANTWALDTSTYATTAALAIKADTTTVNSSLALKADASALTSGLALKADSSAMTTALGLKADASALTSGLALKADQATTYTKTETDALIAAGSPPTLITSAALTTLRNNILLTPSLAPNLGAPYVLTDGALQGQVVYWTGGAFNRPGVIKSRYAETGIATRTSDNATDTATLHLEEVIIPGFLMEANSRLIVSALFGTDNVNASTKAFSILFGTVGSGFAQAGAGPTLSGTNISLDFEGRFINAGLLNRQIIRTTVGVGQTTVLPGFVTKNTAADFTVGIQGRWTTNQALTSAITLYGYTITLE